MPRETFGGVTMDKDVLSSLLPSSSSMDLMQAMSRIESEVGVMGTTGSARDLYHASSLYPYFWVFVDAPATAYEELVLQVGATHVGGVVAPLCQPSSS